MEPCWDLLGARRASWTAWPEHACWDRFGFRVQPWTRVVWNADWRGGLRTGEVLEVQELYLGPVAAAVMWMNVFYESLMDSKSAKDQVHDV